MLADSMYVYTYLQNAGIVVLSLIAYIGLSSNDVKTRSIVISLLMYNCYIFATDWMFEHVSPLQWLLEVAAFCALTIFQIVKQYEYKSDKYNGGTVIIAFYRPKKFSDSFHTVLGAPVSSMSIIAGNDWYMFRRNSKGLCCEVVCERKLDDYVLIDTRVKITQNTTNELDALIGTKARSWRTMFLRINCVYVFRDFLGGLGSKWGFKLFDVSPAIYMLRRR